MADISLLSSNITSSLELGDHQDVRCIVEGKLRDRLEKLLGKKTRDGSIIMEERISDTVRYATDGCLQGSIPLVVSTAEYYREKYSLAI